MLQTLFSLRQFLWLTTWSFFVHSTTCNAPYIHPSHDSILKLWRTFPNALEHEHVFRKFQNNQTKIVREVAFSKYPCIASEMPQNDYVHTLKKFEKN